MAQRWGTLALLLVKEKRKKKIWCFHSGFLAIEEDWRPGCKTNKSDVFKEDAWKVKMIKNNVSNPCEEEEENLFFFACVSACQHNWKCPKWALKERERKRDATWLQVSKQSYWRKKANVKKRKMRYFIICEVKKDDQERESPPYYDNNIHKPLKIVASCKSTNSRFPKFLSQKKKLFFLQDGTLSNREEEEVASINRVWEQCI